MSYDLTYMAVEGGVTVKPSIRYLENGTALCKFGVVTRPKKRGDKHIRDSMYFTVTTIGKVAETAFRVIKIAMPVRVEGEYVDSIYRDKVTDEPKIGRVIYASRVRAFVYWERRKIGKKGDPEKEEVRNMVLKEEDLASLPF